MARAVRLTWQNVSVPVKQTLRWADYPKLVDLQSKTFQQLVNDSIGGSALEVKKAEMAVTDLAVAVRLSNLKAKDSSDRVCAGCQESWLRIAGVGFKNWWCGRRTTSVTQV